MMMPRKTELIASVVLAGTLVAQADIITVGVYDEQSSQMNSVDSIADPLAGGDAPFVIDSTEYAGYVAGVASAYAADMGGVINFDRALVGEIGDGLALNATFGVSSNKTLAITPGGTGLALAVNLTAQTAISAGEGVLPGNVIRTSSAGNSFSLTVGALTGGAAQEVVNSLGFTMLSRAARDRGDINAVATFSDASTATATSNVGPNAGVDDTFFGFIAPDGESIQSITLNFTGGLGGFDDVVFTTAIIPEPGTLALLMGGGLMLALRRRFRM